MLTDVFRLPWTEPVAPSLPELSDDYVLACSFADPWGQTAAVAHALSGDADKPPLACHDPEGGRFLDGPLAGRSYGESADAAHGAPLPVLLERDSLQLVCDDPVALCRALAPELVSEEGASRLLEVREGLVDAVYRLGRITDQADYEAAHVELAEQMRRWDDVLGRQRFLGGDDFDLADVLLFTFSIRLDPVYYELFKATVGLLEDFPALEGHARDLFERAAFYETTDFEAIKQAHYRKEPVLNPKGIVPVRGRPDLDAPHFRAEIFEQRDAAEAVEEDQEAARVEGEWVRPQSEERHWIVPADEAQRDEARYPAEAARYHLYAPYNCPWSHRALLGRAVKGLEAVVGASIVYFRRDPDHGWQFNPAVPGCTEDRANGVDYIEELYASVGSDERSVPVLWDTETDTIVSNESADILRMFATAFEDLAERGIDLYPVGHRDEIDRINAAVYQRINNGAYKAGFADGQAAHERAFRRYFRALDWLDELLGEREWLAGTEAPTEADVRLFPTVFRHDAVYFARFKLNERRIADCPCLQDWLERMLEVPGVREASNLDHARNGYFGRTGNEIVPAGPALLGLSPKDFSRPVWLNSV